MLRKGDIVDNTYRIECEIGSGGTGVVFLAFHTRLKKYVVLKKLKSSNYSISFLRTEVDTLKNLHHRYLPQVYDYIDTGKDIFTVIDYINGCDLKQYKKSAGMFSEGQLIKWLRQLCEVLDYMHTHNPSVLHMDIKPSNIIIDENGDVCLIDFGIAQFWGDKIKGLSSGYASPEQTYFAQTILEGNPDYNYYPDVKSDIYSLGASFFYLITGYEPTIYTDPKVLNDYVSVYSEAFLNVVGKMMSLDRNERFNSASEITRALNNIKKFDKDYKKKLITMISSSVAAGIILIIGVTMLFSGLSAINSDNLNNDYKSFVDCYESGDYDNAVSLGNSILNSDSYKDKIDRETKSQLLHAVGDCFYYKEKYTNAVKYYNFSLQFVSDELSEEYYRDYALALARKGDYDKVDQALSKFSNSSYSDIVKAQFLYSSGKFDQALEILLPITESSDDDNKSLALDICAEIYKSREDIGRCASCYEREYQYNTSAQALRKAAFYYLMVYNNSYSDDKLSLEKANEMYQKLCDSYYCSKDDRINLAQTYRMLGDFSKAETILSELESDFPNDINICMQIVLLKNELGDYNGVKEYCVKARALYSEGNNSGIDEHELETVKELYNKYSEGIW